jgi:pyruvate kinase
MAVKFKRTKIMASLGPATDNMQCVENLIRTGVNGIRLNFSHGSHQEYERWIEWTRTASAEVGKPVAIVADLQGPKIHVGELPQEGVKLEEEGEISFGYKADYSESGVIPVQYDLSKKVNPGELLFLADGKLCAEIVDVGDGIITTNIKVGGKLHSRKGINLPDTDLGGDIITHKDYADIEFAIEQGVDYIALSFVQSGEDVTLLREFLEAREASVKIIAKIETNSALDNIEDVMAASDGVMVARGDLAVEAGPEVVPIAQRHIIGLAQHYGKIAIVATQMLASMTDSSQPTRAEVSDIATAVVCGADCLMLSDETATGNYPTEAVALMKKVSLYAETNSPVEPKFINMEDQTQGSSIASAAITLAHQLQAEMIIAETASGKTARNIAAHRPQMPIIMATTNQQVAQQLAVVYGSKSYYFQDAEKAGLQAVQKQQEGGGLEPGNLVVLTYGEHPGVAGGTDTIKVREVQ